MERGLIAQIDAHDQHKFGVTCWYLEKPVKKRLGVDKNVTLVDRRKQIYN